ncbi:MAG: sigma-54 dependent transcriptional regulator [Granulosicoccus sp.]|nr:sigma-54 dependent transcriptional regulator [Granulosicoccus sp.]
MSAIRNTVVEEDADQRAAEFSALLKSVAVLVVDDEPGMRNFLQRTLSDRCAVLEVAGSAEEAEALRLRYHFDLLIIDIRLPGLSGLEWVYQLRERGVRTHVIYMTAYADLQMAIAAIRNGADDFIMKPFRADQIFAAMQQALQKRQILRENSLLRLQLEQLKSDRGVIGESDAIKETLELAQRVAPTVSTVLIQGETGTGKELVARAIHKLSKRDGPFVAINCGTIQPELLESELFGHTRGAFTGAHQARDGLFIFANNGTLFLDEIGEMPMSMQTKLLRVLEERVVRPVGAEREVPVNVRVVAATNRDLVAQTEAGEFRKDLFYRLNVMPISVAPLRERASDIPLLVEYFFDTLSAELRLPTVELRHSDLVKMQRYDWPGNVRELKNIIERTLLMGRMPSDCIGDELAPDAAAKRPGFPLDWTVEEVERAHMESVLALCNNNKSEAARRLGVSRKTLERKQQQWRSIEASQSESDSVSKDTTQDGSAPATSLTTESA